MQTCNLSTQKFSKPLNQYCYPLKGKKGFRNAENWYAVTFDAYAFVTTFKSFACKSLFEH